MPPWNPALTRISLVCAERPKARAVCCATTGRTSPPHMTIQRKRKKSLSEISHAASSGVRVGARAVGEKTWRHSSTTPLNTRASSRLVAKALMGAGMADECGGK